MYTRENLNQKNVSELREIAKDYGIKNVKKFRKEQLIDEILQRSGGSQQAQMTSSEPQQSQQKESMAKPSKVRFEVESEIVNPEKKFGERNSSKVLISSGATQDDFDVAGQKVGDVIHMLQEILNVDRMSDAVVNGNVVSREYVLQSGDRMELIKPTGRKG